MLCVVIICLRIFVWVSGWVEFAVVGNLRDPCSACEATIWNIVYVSYKTQQCNHTKPVHGSAVLMFDGIVWLWADTVLGHQRALWWRDSGSECKLGRQIKANFNSHNTCLNYNGVIISMMASLITGVSIANLTVCSRVDQRKQQGSASLALWGQFTGDRWIPHT